MSWFGKILCWAISLMFIVFSYDVEAQKYSRRYNRKKSGADIRLGFKAGGNFSTFAGDQWYFQRDENNIQIPPSSSDVERSYDYTIGFHGGIFIDILATRNVHVQIEGVYTRLGAAFNTPLAIPQQGAAPIMASYDTEFAIDYLQIPLLVKLGLGKEDKFRIVLGPSMALKNQEMVSFTLPSQLSEAEQASFLPPTQNIFEGIDLQAQAGIEIQMDLGISIGLRVVRGFKDINLPNNGYSEPIAQAPLEITAENFNQSLNLTIGYTLNHYKRLFKTRKFRRFTFKKRRF